MLLMLTLNKYFPAGKIRERRDYYTNVLNVLKIENEDITTTSKQTFACSNINNRYNRISCETCSKLIIKAPERRH